MDTGNIRRDFILKIRTKLSKVRIRSKTLQFWHFKSVNLILIFAIFAERNPRIFSSQSCPNPKINFILPLKPSKYLFWLDLHALYLGRNSCFDLISGLIWVTLCEITNLRGWEVEGYFKFGCSYYIWSNPFVENNEFIIWFFRRLNHSWETPLKFKKNHN